MDFVNLFAHLGARLCRTSGNESVSPITLMNTLHVTIECRKVHQLPASEMLCNEGRQDFDFIAAEFVDGVLTRCLSCFITWNFWDKWSWILRKNNTFSNERRKLFAGDISYSVPSPLLIKTSADPYLLPRLIYWNKWNGVWRLVETLIIEWLN